MKRRVNPARWFRRCPWLSNDHGLRDAARRRSLRPAPCRKMPACGATSRPRRRRLCHLNPLERRGLVRIEVGNVDQRERVAYLTAAGGAAIEAALPHWRKAQERIAALVRPSAIGNGKSVMLSGMESLRDMPSRRIKKKDGVRAGRDRGSAHVPQRAEIARAQSGREHLAIHARQLALEPRLQILRRHPRPLLLRLE